MIENRDGKKWSVYYRCLNIYMSMGHSSLNKWVFCNLLFIYDWLVECFLLEGSYIFVKA